MQTRLLLLICLLFSLEGIAQQIPQFTQYHRNQYLINPAAAGTYDFIDVTIGGRMQWAGLAESPRTTYAYVSAPLKPNNFTPHNPSLRTSEGIVRNPEIKTGKLKHALGGIVLADQYGAFRQIKTAVTYSLHLPVAEGYNLAFGTNLGISNRAFLSDKATVHTVMTNSGTADNVYDQFLTNQGNQNTMDLGLGLHFYSKKMFIGISADQVTQDFVKFGNTAVTFAPGLHLYGTAGFKFQLNDNFTLMPTVLAKYIAPAPVSIEGTLQLEYKEWMWMGLAYRNEDAVIAMFGMNINERFKFGYSYDYTISRLTNYSSGGHELVLGLMLGR